VLAYTLPEAPLARPVLETLRDETAQWNALDTSLPGGLHPGEMDVVQAYLLGLLSFRLADYAAVRTHMNQLATRADASSNALARAAALTLEALLAWHREEPNKALTLLDEAEMPLPFHVRGRSPLYEQLLNRYLRAEILFAENQDREALAWYASLYDGYHQWGLIYLEPSYQRRAVLYQRLGERERAVSFYERFIALRQDADPTLQPAVARARHQLDSLRIAF
jgi:tetratricopeptide (TPR) repeat protein